MSHPAAESRPDSLARRLLSHDLTGLVVLVAGTFALLLPRVRMQTTVWVDEVFSVMMANRTFGDIVGLTQFDAHPPLYYYLLKIWMKVFRLVGIEPGTVETRLFGVAVFLAFLVLCWFGLRRLMGRSAGSLATLVLAVSPIMGGYAAEIRHYALLLPMGCGLWLILCRMIWRERLDAEPPSRRERLLSWAAYAALAAMMLWMHLLSGLILFWLGILWLVMLALPGRRRGALLIGGAAAQAAALAVFLPWVPQAIRNLRYLRDAGTSWMTPADVLHAWATPFFWGVFGKSSYLDIAIHWSALLMGIGAILLPLVMLPAAVAAPRRKAEASPLLLVGVSGVAIGVAAMLTMFYASYFGVAKLFHAPRYPMMAMPMVLVGVVALSAWSLRRCGLAVHWAWILCAFLIYCFWRGHQYHLFHFYQGPATTIHAMDAGRFPAHDVPVYIHPGAVHPLHRGSVPHETVLPITRFAEHPPDEERLLVFLLSIWPKSEHPDDMAFRAAVVRNMLSESHEYEELFGGGVLLTLDRPDPTMLRRFAEMPWHRALRYEADGVASIAAPERQRGTDGWSLPEITDIGQMIRHAVRSRVVLRFDQPLEPGPHQLRFVGHNPDWPSAPARFVFQLVGDEQTVSRDIMPGHFQEWIDIEVSRASETPALIVWRDPVTPPDSGESTFGREFVHFVLTEAWLHPRTGEPTD